MRLLDRFRRQPPDHPTALPLRVLRADGQRIDLTSRDAGPRLVAVRQEWQSDAWAYRDMIGELRYAQRLLARSVARCRFYAAELRDWPEDPAELTGTDHQLDKQLASDAVDNLARLPLDDDPDGFLAALAENLATPGEGWIHGQQNGQDETWTVRSVSEIVSAGDRIMLAELPNTTSLGQRPIDPDSEELLRCWIRHPRWGQLADSPLRAMLDTCEEIVLTGREIRAAARSRIAANGILKVPESLSLVRTRSDEEELAGQSVMDDEFMADLTTFMTIPIRNEGDAGAVVPIVLRGPAEDLKSLDHLRLDRDNAGELLERMNGAVLRMLRGLDIQPEQVQGLGDSNHWSAWSIEAANVRHQVEPMAAIIAGCLTKAFLRPALQSQELGHDPDQVKRVVVWYDTSGLVENPNRGQDARDAHDRLAISDEALRVALGFDDDDAPDEDELHRRIASRYGVDQATSAIVLGLAQQFREGQGSRAKVIDAAPANGLPSGRGQPQQGPRSPKPGETVPEKTTPDEPSSAEPDRGMTAAGSPDLPGGWRVDVALARALAEVDTTLAERILTAADAAIARAVERAGGRARNAVRSDQVLAASIQGVDAVLVPHTLGRDALLAAVNLPDLLADAYGRLRDQVGGWLAQASRQVADLVLRTLGLDRRSTAGRRVHDAVTTRLAVHRDAAWTALAESLDAAAEAAMFRADPLNPEPAGRGEEMDTLISPAEVHRALVIAGGGQPDRPGDGGLGTGPVVRDVFGDEGALLLGWEWQYRPERIRNTYPPHLALDGARFATWTDPKLGTDETSRWVGSHFRPGDHKGCFVAGTEVSGPPAFASFSRPYVGEGIELRTQSGKLLTGTPNHPILTPHGWVPLGELTEGDEVIVASGSQRAPVVDDEAHQVPALIEDVAASLPMTDSVMATPVPTSAEDFHGDGSGSDGQVTVVRTDRRLLIDRQPTGAEFGGDDVLQLGREGSSTLPTEGVPAPLLPREGLAAHGSVGRPSEGLPVLGGGPPVPVAQGIGPPARLNASFQQDPADDRAGDVVPLSEGEFASTSGVGRSDSTLGAVQLAGGVDRFATTGITVGLRPTSPVLGGRGGILEGSRLCAPPEGDVVVDQHSPDGALVPAEHLGQLGQSSTLSVSGDQIVSAGWVPSALEPASGRARVSVLHEDPVNDRDAGSVSTSERPHGLTGGAQLEQFGNPGISSAPRFSGPVLSDDPLDRRDGYAIPATEALNRFTGGVATEQVVEIARRPLGGHVYNLSTTTGWYVANGVIVHNCRCWAAPLWSVQDADDEGIVARRLREAAESEQGRTLARVAAEDTAAGRVGTSVQNTVEVRERLRRHYIEGGAG